VLAGPEGHGRSTEPLEFREAVGRSPNGMGSDTSAATAAARSSLARPVEGNGVGRGRRAATRGGGTPGTGLPGDTKRFARARLAWNGASILPRNLGGVARGPWSRIAQPECEAATLESSRGREASGSVAAERRRHRSGSLAQTAARDVREAVSRGTPLWSFQGPGRTTELPRVRGLEQFHVERRCGPLSESEPHRAPVTREVVEVVSRGTPLGPPPKPGRTGLPRVRGLGCSGGTALGSSRGS
jgi:hypothetical protein